MFSETAEKKPLIRPVSLGDVEDINEMRRQEGIREYTLALATETLASTENFLRNLGPDDHLLVAEKDGKVVGMTGLHILKNARQRHTAGLGLMVREEFQGQGIGKKLVESILDLADSWLMLARLELEVTEDNERAISLYRAFGFEVEGKKKFSIIKDGKYANLLMMARYRVPAEYRSITPH